MVLWGWWTTAFSSKSEAQETGPIDEACDIPDTEVYPVQPASDDKHPLLYTPIDLAWANSTMLQLIIVLLAVAKIVLVVNGAGTW